MLGIEALAGGAGAVIDSCKKSLSFEEDQEGFTLCQTRDFIIYTEEYSFAQ